MSQMSSYMFHLLSLNTVLERRTTQFNVFWEYSTLNKQFARPLYLFYLVIQRSAEVLFSYTRILVWHTALFLRAFLAWWKFAAKPWKNSATHSNWLESASQAYGATRVNAYAVKYTLLHSAVRNLSTKAKLDYFHGMRIAIDGKIIQFADQQTLFFYIWIRYSEDPIIYAHPHGFSDIWDYSTTLLIYLNKERLKLSWDLINIWNNTWYQ